MNPNEENLSTIGRSLLNRRLFMKNTGFSLGALGLAQLLGKEGLLASEDPTSFSGKTPIRPDIDPDNLVTHQGSRKCPKGVPHRGIKTKNQDSQS